MKRDDLTPTMRAFVQRQVREGRALNEAEFLRFLVAAEIRRWERVHRQPFPSS